MRSGAPLSQVHDGFSKGEPHASCWHVSQSMGGAGSRPEDILAREKAGIVESAGIDEIAELAHAGVQLDGLSVVELGKRLIGPRVESHLGARGARAPGGSARPPADGRRFDLAAGKDHDLAAFRFEFRRQARPVHKIDQDSCEEETRGRPEASGGEAGVAPNRQDAQKQEGADDGEEFRIRGRVRSARPG